MLELGDGKITISIPEGLYQTLQIICTDKSTNLQNESNVCEMTISDISVSPNPWIMFWTNEPLRWGVIGGIGVVMIGLISWVIIKTKRKSKHDSVDA